MEPRQDGQAEEPEPEEEEHLEEEGELGEDQGNLLIDDVEGEDTEAVEPLLPRRRAHRVEGAAGVTGDM